MSIWFVCVCVKCCLLIASLEGMKWMKWKKLKYIYIYIYIYLEYSILSLFESFNEENERFISLFESLSGGKWNG